MVVTATEFKANFGKYLELIAEENYITRVFISLTSLLPQIVNIGTVIAWYFGNFAILFACPLVILTY